MNYWSILGIDPTKDIKKIKSAYAKKAKEYHPEEHPKEFQQLQNAYKAALDYAKGQETIVIPPEVSTSSEFDSGATQAKTEEQKIQEQIPQVEIPETPYIEPPVLKMNFYDYERIPNAFHQDENAENQFFRELNYMLRHPYMRQIPAYWDAFMNRKRYREFMWDADFREKFLERLEEKSFFFHKEARTYFEELWKDFKDKDLDVRLTKNSILVFKMSECMTKEEKEAYDAIWNDRTHGKGENAGSYLETYFHHAEMNEEKLKDIYENAHEARKKRSDTRKYVIGAIFVLTIRYVIRYVL